MLSLSGIRFRYGRDEPWVLDDLDVSVEPGRVVGLWGPSGCGKTTIGAIAAGVLRPVVGEVQVDGRRLGEYRGPRPVQVVGQHPLRAMNPRWRISAVLDEGSATPGPDEDWLVDPGWLDRYPHELSGGELQRVCLARALRVQPRYLVADEISASLDAITQAMLWRHLRGRIDSGLGVLAISHDRDLIGAVADDVIDLMAAVS